MKNQEEKIIDYLYGELKGKDLQDFESWLMKNPKAMEEVKQLRDLRAALKSIPDQEVIVPSELTGPSQSGAGKGRSRLLNGAFLWAGAIAAAVTLVILVGVALGVRIEAGGGQVVIAFGDGIEDSRQHETPGDLLTKAEMEQILAKREDALQSEIGNSIRDIRKDLDEDLNTRLASWSSGGSSKGISGQAEMNKIIESLRQELQKDNEEYLNHVLTEFYMYMESQRADDLQYYQARLNNLEDETNLFQYEAGAMLTSLTGNPVFGNNK